MTTKIRKCGYARVSTKAEEQSHSLINQADYFKWLIEGDEAAEFVGIYADTKSGKDARSRPQLMAMLKACRRGEIDYIVTKSISRFARSLLDTLRICRELREIGVGIYFEREAIDTLDNKSDFVLSLYAAVAESELTSMGDNVKWAARKRAAKGAVELTKIYGYDYKDKGLHILPHEAAIVKEIFTRYASGEGQLKIAKSLVERGIPRKVSTEPWRVGTIRNILASEKYIGCCLTQKTYKEGGKTKINNGELEQFFIEGSHEAIVDRALWDKVQLRLKAAKERSRGSAQYILTPFSGKLKCRECCKGYTRRKNNRGTPYEKWIWSCSTYTTMGRKYCKGKSIREKDLQSIFLTAYNEAAGFVNDTDPQENLSEAIKSLLAQERELISLKVKGYITREAYDEQHTELVKQIKDTEAELLLAARRSGRKKFDIATEYQDGLVRALDIATLDDFCITFAFKNGAVIKRTFNNNADRKKTWAAKTSGGKK